MQIYKKAIGRIFFANLLGPLNSTTVNMVFAELSLSIGAYKYFVFDLTRVNVITAAGVELLTLFFKQMADKKGLFVICGIPDSCREFLSVAGVDQIIPIFINKKKAIDYLNVLNARSDK